LNIQVGDTVRWSWGSGTHNLRTTSGVEEFESGYHSSTGYQFMHEFTEIGSTEFVFDPHPGSMFGRITVSE
jgi:plastocyanin|tara:strand:- start:590 stop:802 length:213 start_codon:yes stop_codon:yes gene_type:complete